MSKTVLSDFLNQKRELSLANRERILSYFGIKAQLESRDLSAEEFRFVSDWHHVALLNHIGTTGKKLSFEKLSRNFDVPEDEMKEALVRLVKLGLIEETAPTTYRRNGAFFKTQSEVPSRAIRNFHFQILQKACHSLEEVDVTQREFGAVVLPVDETNYELIKEEIRKFKDAVSKLSASSSAKSKVSVVSVQLFPLETDSKKGGDL